MTGEERVREHLDALITPRVDGPDLDPFPATVEEVAELIEQYVFQLEQTCARGVYPHLSRLIGEREAAWGDATAEQAAWVDPEEVF